MRKIENNLKECALALVMVILCASGIISGAGSINYGAANGEWLYILAGIAGIAVTIYAVRSFYVEFLKPGDRK